MNQLEPYNFFFELPLYTKIHVTEANGRDFMDLMMTKKNIDAYNPILKQQTTFVIVRNPWSNKSQLTRDRIGAYQGISEFELQCVRNNYRMKIFLNVNVIYHDDDQDKIEECTVMKIGQYPSIADIHISKIRQYDKVLSNDKLKEITKAVGLAANGVGIGSFVYLRRVFEYLIEESHQIAKTGNGWDEQRYVQNRMIEKIDQLNNHLPSFLVENKNLYSILSKGIHELEENECLEYFEAVKVGIELILDEKVEEYNKMKKIEEAKKRIQNIGQQLSKK
jgi:hypothetical protein